LIVSPHAAHSCGFALDRQARPTAIFHSRHRGHRRARCRLCASNIEYLNAVAESPRAWWHLAAEELFLAAFRGAALARRDLLWIPNVGPRQRNADGRRAGSKPRSQFRLSDKVPAHSPSLTRTDAPRLTSAPCFDSASLNTARSRSGRRARPASAGSTRSCQLSLDRRRTLSTPPQMMASCSFTCSAPRASSCLELRHECPFPPSSATDVLRLTPTLSERERAAPRPLGPGDQAPPNKR